MNKFIIMYYNQSTFFFLSKKTFVLLWLGLYFFKTLGSFLIIYRFLFWIYVFTEPIGFKSNLEKPTFSYLSSSLCKYYFEV